MQSANQLGISGFFQHIASGASSKCLEDILIVFMHRKNQDSHLLGQFFNLFCCLNPIDVGHSDIHQDDIWLESLCFSDSMSAILGLTDNLHIGLCIEHHLQASA